MTLLPAVLGLCFPRSSPAKSFSLQSSDDTLGDDIIIRCLDTKTNTVFETGLEEYLVGVLAAEMPASYEPEALKAQAVVARTYTLYKIVHNSTKHKNADICDNSSCCQAWIKLTSFSEPISGFNRFTKSGL